MQTRNIILLIIVLIIVAVAVFGFFYLRQPNVPTAVPNSNTNFVSTLWPFGNKSPNTDTTPKTTPPANTSGYQAPTETPSQTINLKRISSMPIAGYGVFMKQRYGTTVTPENVPYVRYADKATGYIYETFADNINEIKFSSTEVPGLHDASFGGSGESVIIRYLKNDEKTIETYSGILPKETPGAPITGDNPMTGSFLPENISDVSISPDFSKIFYVVPSGSGVAGITANISGSGKNQVFSSSFTEWLSQWPNNRMITLTTKPSGDVPGYMYAVDPTTKSFNKILGGINGLTTLTSPSGRLILYADNGLSLNIYNQNTGTTISAGVNTLPEKCVWGSASDTIYCAVPRSIDQSKLYPDDWYQGTVSFSDQIWKIDAASGNGTLLADPISSQDGVDVDAINLKLDQNEKYLFFVNKNDSYLWELGL